MTIGSGPRPTRTQPAPRPDTLAEVRALLDAGELVNLAGEPLTLADCGTCPGAQLGETCPRAVTCPTCGATPGRPCRRPSGHDIATPGRVHDTRSTAAEAVDEQRERAGDPTLPAPWPTPAPDPSEPDQLTLFQKDPPHGGSACMTSPSPPR